MLFRSERTGPRSGQTLREAIVLRVELTVGVPLVVPLAGRFISWAASLMSACSSVHPPRLGMLRLEEGAHSTSPVGGAPGAGAAEPDCAMFSGPDDHGRSLPRLPLRVIAEAQMQSAARQSNRTPGSSTGARAGGSSSGSDHLPIAPREGLIISAVEGAGADSRIGTTSDQADRQAGFLQIGGEREIWAPGSCGIPPS